MSKSIHQNFDVIVVGAGPSGAVLAYELASNVVKTLLLEKSKLPRYKACAGGIALRTASLLPFDIKETVEDVIYSISMSYKLGKKTLKTYDQPLIYMVMRDKFDYLLAGMAGNAGVAIRDGECARYVELSRDRVSLKTDGSSYMAQIIVGADGANSIVAKSVDITGGIEFGIGLQSEVYVDKGRLAEWNGIIGMDLGSIWGGCGWIFPKRSHISVGVGGLIGTARRLRQYLLHLLEDQNFGDYQIWSLKGHLMPSRKRGRPVVKHRVLLIGDAAGFIDAVTGEGIYYAIRSAQLATPVIMKALQDGFPVLAEYEQAVDRELMPALEIAQKVAKFATRASSVFNLLKHNEMVWKAGCQLLRGERAYPTLEGVRSVLGLRRRRLTE